MPRALRRRAARFGDLLPGMPQRSGVSFREAWFGLLLLVVMAVVRADAQSPADLVITNARIVVGTGEVVDRGTIVVRDGRLSEVMNSTPTIDATSRVDAAGLTVVPGLIDTHRHLLINLTLDSDADLDGWMEAQLAASMRAYLESGITTVMSTGDYFPAILDVRRRLNSGELLGPRLLVAGPIFTAPDGHPAVTICRDNPWCRALVAVEVDSREAAREHVRELAAAGVDAIKAAYDGRLGVQIADDVLTAIGEEADRQGIPLVVHVTNVRDTLMVLGLGVNRFVHPPFAGTADGSGVGAALRERGVPMSTTTSAIAAFRDGPDGTVTPYGTPYNDAVFNNGLANVRQLWDEGVIVAYGTDTLVSPADAIRLETESLNRVLTASEMLTAMTANASTYLGLSGEVGTLEPGKVADILLVEGDPVTDIADLANVRVVIKDGVIVVDNR